jgi:hypothetical protein
MTNLDALILESSEKTPYSKEELETTMLLMQKIQKDLKAWTLQYLQDIGTSDIMSPTERALRVVEEAIEFAQASGISQEAVSKINQVVYEKPAGTVFQELGGCFLTLLAACETHNLNAFITIMVEWNRINQRTTIEKIREKQRFKISQGITADGGT